MGISLPGVLGLSTEVTGSSMVLAPRFMTDLSGALTRGRDCFNSLTIISLTGWGGSLAVGTDLADAKKLALVGFI